MHIRNMIKQNLYLQIIINYLLVYYYLVFAIISYYYFISEVGIIRVYNNLMTGKRLVALT